MVGGTTDIPAGTENGSQHPQVRHGKAAISTLFMPNLSRTMDPPACCGLASAVTSNVPTRRWRRRIPAGKTDTGIIIGRTWGLVMPSDSG